MTKEQQPGTKQDNEQPLGAQYTGEGFMSYDDLVSIVQAYQQRVFCEDVDTIKKIGGKLTREFRPNKFRHQHLIRQT
jgi:hypothetical protein